MPRDQGGHVKAPSVQVVLYGPGARLPTVIVDVPAQWCLEDAAKLSRLMQDGSRVDLSAGRGATWRVR